MLIKMKPLSKSILIAVAALGFWGCNEDEPKPETPLEVLPANVSALREIYKSLDMDSEDYPVQWNPEDMSTWKKAGIELDTITDEESQQSYLAVVSITLYLTHKNDFTPEALLSLGCLKDLKVYACAGSYFNGRMIPASVESLLVDRLNPDDPGYIIGVPNGNNGTVILGQMKAVFSKLIIHGVDMKGFDCKFSLDADIFDISHNTLEGEAPNSLRYLKNPANLSYNRYTSLDGNWDYWIASDKAPDVRSMPNLQHNQINIPEDVLNTEFWKEHHENFIGNPGYKAPEQ